MYSLHPPLLGRYGLSTFSHIFVLPLSAALLVPCTPIGSQKVQMMIDSGKKDDLYHEFKKKYELDDVEMEMVSW